MTDRRPWTGQTSRLTRRGWTRVHPPRTYLCMAAVVHPHHHRPDHHQLHQHHHTPDCPTEDVAPDEPSGIVKLQRLVRAKSRGPAGVRLHAKNLGDRLIFERGLVRGTFRLVNQLSMFVFILYGLWFGSQPPSVQRGIYNNLREPSPLPPYTDAPSLVLLFLPIGGGMHVAIRDDRAAMCLQPGDSFGFDSILKIESRDAFVEALPKLSHAAKKYLALSSQVSLPSFRLRLSTHTPTLPPFSSPLPQSVLCRIAPSWCGCYCPPLIFPLPR